MAESDELLPDFLAEAFDIVEKLYADLDKVLSMPERGETIDAIFRNVHTLKGSSAMFNFNHTKDIAHELETFLSSFKNNPAQLSEREIQYSREEIQKIEELLKAKDQLDLLPGKGPSRDTSTEGSATVKITSPAPSTPSSDDFIRVPVNRINESMNSVAEVFLVRNQMVYLVERYKSGEIEKRDFFQNWDLLESSLRRGVGELERSTMSMRMMSVQGVFARMARVVQSYSASSKKKIHFQTSGESTELDKKILDTLGEPLIHLIRNAMDHGIESSEDRIKANKAEIGTITLSAKISGNEAIIQISDDGKGMDGEKILASAKKKGLDTTHVTNNQQAIELIFLPGFSTAETVSEVSGRGVGMDAVKTSVTALDGKIIIDTEVGKGSTFTIRLPVSMSLAPVVIANIKGLLYAIPTHDILETRQIAVDQIKKNSGKDYVYFRNQFIQCIDIRNLVEAENKSYEENMRLCSVIFFQHGHITLATRVSHFESNTEILVKPLSHLVPKISWIYGVSVLPTGESIFILSLPKMTEFMEVKDAA